MKHLAKRTLSMLMAVLMVLSLIPAAPHVHAEGYVMAWEYGTAGDGTSYDWLQGAFDTADDDYIYEEGQAYDWKVTLCPTKASATITVEATLEDASGNPVGAPVSKEVEVGKAPAVTTIVSPADFPELGDKIGTFTLSATIIFAGSSIAHVEGAFERTGAAGNTGATNGNWTYAPTYEWLEGHFNTSAVNNTYGKGQAYDWTVSIYQGKTDASLTVDALVLDEEGAAVASVLGKAVTAKKDKDSVMLSAADMEGLSGSKLGNFTLVCTVKFQGEPVAEVTVDFSRTGVSAADTVTAGSMSIGHKGGNEWINGSFNYERENLIYIGDEPYDWTYTIAPTRSLPPAIDVSATITDAEGNVIDTVVKSVPSSEIGKGPSKTIMVQFRDFTNLTRFMPGTFHLACELTYKGTRYAWVEATFSRTPVVYEDNVQYKGEDGDGTEESYEWLDVNFDGNNADTWGVSICPGKEPVTAKVVAKLMDKNNTVLETVTKEAVECGKAPAVTWVLSSTDFTTLSSLYGDLTLICDVMMGDTVYARVTKTFTRTCDHSADQVTVPGVPAGCTSHGTTDGKKCSACGEMTVPQQPIERLGHNMQETTPATVTCTEDGKTAIFTCANGCGKTEGGEDKKAEGHNPAASCLGEVTCEACGTVLPALDHSYDFDNICMNGCGKTLCENTDHDPAASCLQEEWCIQCGEILAQLDHNYSGEGGKCVNGCGKTQCENEGHKPGAAATCTSNQTCTVCGVELNAQLQHAYTGEGAKCANGCGKTQCENEGHKPGAAATCTSNQTCTACGVELNAQLQHAYTGEGDKCVNGCGKTQCENEGHKPGAAATCTSNQTCTVCGVELNAQLQHAYTGEGDKCVNGCGKTQCENEGHKPGAAATCTSNQTCTACGVELNAQLQHAYTGEGAKCANGCGKTKCENEGHDWEPATLEKPKTCKVCGETEGDVATCNHKWNDGEITTAPTCTAEGVKTFTCSACSATKTEKVNALTHNMQQTAAAVPATCGVPGKTAVLTCANGCGKTEGGVEIPALEHNMVETAAAVPATCVAPGKTAVQACANEGCNVIYGGEDVKPLDHAYTGEGGKCVNGCGKTKCGNEGHDWEPATLEKPKTCKVCGETEGDVATCNHKWNDGEITTAPTCTEQGVKTFTCSECKETKTEKVSALGHKPGAAATCTTAQTCTVCNVELAAKLAHTEKTVAGKAATCTEVGLTEGKICSVCNTVIVAQTEIAKLAHTEKTVAGKAATCTATGLTEGKVCSVCDTVIVAQTEIPMEDHHWIAATLTTPKTCKDCGLTEGGVATCQHEWIPATCTTLKTCKLCNETEGKLAPHDMKETAAAVEATCEAAGKTAVTTCSACGHTEGGEEIAKLAHTEVTVPGKAATCTETGLTEGKKCSVCGTETVKQTEIAKLAHTEVTVPGKAATCTETGLTEGKKCSVCGTETVEQTVIPALNHNFVDGTCANCGAKEEEKDPVLPGDADGNGKVNLRDAILVLKAINGGNAVDDAFADFNGDGKVNLKDAILILKEANKK